MHKSRLAGFIIDCRTDDIDQAANFYAQHPTLVKSIGAGALALLMSRMSRRA